jgi:cellulose synthase/poly-beta-1,6-N-acetylglucosamine synthase-like glycosyltransferase
MHAAADIVLALIATPALLCCLYLLALTLLSARPARPALQHRNVRFDVIVPAHNESQLIGRTISSLVKMDWPADAFRVICVADNCTDDTGALARSAGALVLERHDPQLRGKGYALLHAFEASHAADWADALVIVDADSDASGNLLAAMAARIQGGACAIQAHYGVRNALASWRTRLMSIAMGSFHSVRSRARERLGLSCGLRGNGWCVTRELLRDVPYRAFSLAEDIEYGIAIGLAGYRVHYVDEAHVNGDMVSSADLAVQQRQRWENGRNQLIRSMTGPLLRRALQERSLVSLDLALDLLVPPLSYLALYALVFTGLALAGSRFGLAAMGWPAVALAACTTLTLYVLRGWQLSGVGAQGALDLIRVPWFLVWKIWIMLGRRATREWARTGRENS